MLTDDEMTDLDTRARAAPDERCCLALAELGQHAYGCTRERHPARLVVSARDVVALVEEVRRLRRERDALLLDRGIYRDRLNRSEGK